MPAPNYHNYTTVSGSTLSRLQTGSISSNNTLVEHPATEPGEYNGAELWTGGLVSGDWGGIIKSGSATAITVDSYFKSPGGVNIPLGVIESQTLYEIGVTEVSGSAGQLGGVYLFKRRRDITVKERK